MTDLVGPPPVTLRPPGEVLLPDLLFPRNYIISFTCHKQYKQIGPLSRKLFVSL